MAKTTIAFVIVALAVAHLVVGPSEAVTCSDLVSPVAQCAPFAVGSVPQPSSSCCSEIKRVNGMAKTTQDRQQVCYCLKLYVPAFPSVKDNLLSALPSKCGVSLPYTLSVNANCESIN